MRNIKAIGFDLGRTLVEDESVPLSWKSLYKDALSEALIKCNADISDNKIIIGEEILLKYNTRENYRELEVSSDLIFTEVLNKWGLCVEQNLNIIKETFFSLFS